MKRLHCVTATAALWTMALASALMADSLNGKRLDYIPGFDPQPHSKTAVSKPRTRVLTEANRGSSVTLKTGETLMVRLPDNASTGNVWSLVTMPDSPVALRSQRRLRSKAATGVVGAAGIHEFRFVAVGKAAFSRVTYLKLLQLRPFEKGIANATLWEIKVTIPAS